MFVLCLLSDLARLASSVVLLAKMRLLGNAKDISFNAQLLLFAALGLRHVGLPTRKLADSATLSRLAALLCQCAVVERLLAHSNTVDGDNDLPALHWLLLPCWVLGVGLAVKRTVVDSVRIVGVLLDTAAVVPQLVLVVRTGCRVDGLVALHMVLLAAHRLCGPGALGAVNWGWGKCTIVVNSSSEVHNGTLTVGVVNSINAMSNVDVREVMAICLALQSARLPRGYSFRMAFFDNRGLVAYAPAAARIMVGFPVVGIVGCLTNGMTVAMQDKGVSASGIPQVAHGAMGAVLSDRKRFPHFLRTPATDTLTSYAIVMLLAHYGVTKMAMVGTDDSHGRSGISNAKLYASRLATPIQVVTESFFSPTLKTPTDLLDTQASGADTIVAFCQTDTCVPLLEQARVLGMLNKPKVCILGADLASVIRHNTTILCFSTGLGNGAVKKQFEADMLQFTNRSGFTWSTYFAFDAALAYITAIQQMLAAGQSPWDRSALFETLRALRYTGSSGPISFDHNGDRFATMTITSWQPGATTQTTIGNWSIGSGVVIDPQYEIYPPPVSVDPGSPESLPLGAIVAGTVGAAGALLAVGTVLLVLHQQSRQSLLTEVEMERNQAMSGILRGESGNNWVVFPRGRIALIFTDIQQSTELWETNCAIMKPALYQHHRIMRATFRKWNGVEVKTEGDAFMIAFQNVWDAVSFAAEAQKLLLEAPWDPKLLEHPAWDGTLIFRGLRVRMGIHVGEPDIDESAETAREDLEASMGKVTEFGILRDLGPVTFKGIAKPENIHEFKCYKRLSKEKKALWMIEAGEIKRDNSMQGKVCFGVVFKGYIRSVNPSRVS
eukprot:m51a1_g5875 putative adenylate cyclase (835) ;mRNA; r:486325-491984